MADETTPTPPPAGDGHINPTLVLIIGLSLIACVAFEGLVMLACLKYPPQDWNLINTGAGHLNTISVMLGGGLIGLARRNS